MYSPSETRYEHKENYNFCGSSGLLLPKIALGLWHNFGDVDDALEAKNMLTYAFDQGITHFDLANNYGTPYGSAERNFGKILQSEFKNHRHEMVISTKAGYDMWPGPYGIGGSRKYLITSCEQSLKRLQIDYVDIFYSHRYDANTPLEETMYALSTIVKQGKALYVGLSNYPTDKAQESFNILKSTHTPCLIYQGKYSIFARNNEFTTIPLCKNNGVGYIAFSPLAQGLLSDKYLNGIPADSRAAHTYGHLQTSQINSDKLAKIEALNAIAQLRGQSLPQMALAWTLRNDMVTSTIVGTSSVKQLQENLEALKNTHFTDEEMWRIGELAE